MAFTRFVLGQARAQVGRATEGVELIRQGIDALHEIGMRVTTPYLVAELAVAQGLDGALADALRTIEQALKTHPIELGYRTEELRIRGELRRKQGETELAAADFRESILLAQGMGARAWELRAKTSLAQLLSDRGRRAEARAILAGIYNWFTEGFDTADLKDAKALLGELSN